MFKVPVLLNPTQESISHEALVVIAVKSYEGIFYVDIGYENDLLVGRGNLVVPLFDNNCIGRNGLIVFLEVLALELFGLNQSKFLLFHSFRRGLRRYSSPFVFISSIITINSPNSPLGNPLLENQI